MAQMMQEQNFTTPNAQQPQMMTTSGTQPWLGVAAGSPRGNVKKRRSEKDFPGIPKGYWWTPSEALEARKLDQYIKVNGGSRSNLPSKPQGFSFEATILKGAPFKKRTNKKTGQVNEQAYSGQGLHVAFLDTLKIGNAPAFLARLSGDPEDIAYALIFAKQVSPDGQDFFRLDETGRKNFLTMIAAHIVAQSYNYYTIVENERKGMSTIDAMNTWNRLKNTTFYTGTTLYRYLSDPQLKNYITGLIPVDLFSRFIQESRKRIGDKDEHEQKLNDFQSDVLLYIFLSHHIKGPDCSKIGPDGQEIEPYTLPGSRRRHTFASLLQEVYNDPQHVIDISPLFKGGNYRKAKTPKLSKDKTTRAKGVPVNFSVTIDGQSFDVIDKVYSNNLVSVDLALKEIGFDAQTIAGIKSNVNSLLYIKAQARLAKQKNPLPKVLEFVDKGASCQVTHYSSAPASAGISAQSNIEANVGQLLETETEGAEASDLI